MVAQGFLFFFFNRLLLNIPSIIAVANSCSSASNFKDHSIFRTIFSQNCSSDPKNFANSWPLASNPKDHSIFSCFVYLILSILGLIVLVIPKIVYYLLPLVENINFFCKNVAFHHQNQFFN